MNTEIEKVTGRIWRLLDFYDELTTSDLVRLTGWPHEVVLMGAGWLVRQGHVVMKRDTNGYKMKIRMPSLKTSPL